MLGCGSDNSAVQLFSFNIDCSIDPSLGNVVGWLCLGALKSSANVMEANTMAANIMNVSGRPRLASVITNNCATNICPIPDPAKAMPEASPSFLIIR